MFNRNYTNLEELIKMACKTYNVKPNNFIYPKVVSLCVGYFWHEISQVQFKQELELLIKSSR